VPPIPGQVLSFSLFICFRFHSEGGIVRTIFGLLFFDIIFASIPGAFETPYQSAPLDIAEDSFYHARKDLIEARLGEIENNTASQILERVDIEHREKGTWCVGVRWDLFERQDLIEIVQVSH
jgi:Fanconi-associated nuclease 1